MPRTTTTSTRIVAARRETYLIPVRLVAIPADPLWWTVTPGMPGSFVSLKYIIDVVTTTASDGVTIQPTVAGTAIGGLLLTLTSANTDATPGYGGEVAGTDPVEGDDFDADEEIGLLGVLNVGAFAEGSGYLELVVDLGVRA